MEKEDVNKLKLSDKVIHPIYGEGDILEIMTNFIKVRFRYSYSCNPFILIFCDDKNIDNQKNIRHLIEIKLKTQPQWKIEII